MVLLYCVLPGTYAVIAAAVGLAFGPHYYAPNLGLIFTATTAYFSIILVVSQVETLFHLLNYSGMFLLAGGTAASGLVVTLLMEGNIKRERQERSKLAGQ